MVNRVRRFNWPAGSMKGIYVSLLGLGVRVNAPFFLTFFRVRRPGLADILPCNTMLTCVERPVWP